MLLRNPAMIERQGRKLWHHGNAAPLDQPLDALLCSRACPGVKILEAMDLAQRWRAENRPVISSFHTPVEKECLRIFLRGPQPLVVCPARGLEPFLLPKEMEAKFQRKELLIISPFDSNVRRATKETAEERIRLIFELAARHTVIHASAGGLLERIVKEQLHRSVPHAEEEKSASA